MKKTLTRTTLRVVVQSETLPDRVADIRFLVYDECDRVAQANDRRVMKHGLRPEIVKRTDATATIEVQCYLLDPLSLADVEVALRQKFEAGLDEVVVEFDS